MGQSQGQTVLLTTGRLRWNALPGNTAAGSGGGDCFHRRPICRFRVTGDSGLASSSPHSLPVVRDFAGCFPSAEASFDGRFIRARCPVSATRQQSPSVSRNVLMLVHQCYQGIRPFSLIGDYPGQIGDHHQGVVDPAVFGRVEEFSRFTERPESRWHLHLCNEDPIPQAFVVGAEIPDRSQVAQHGLKDPFIDLK